MPTLVTYNKTSYKSDDEILHETDIGPEVTHIYQVQIEIEICTTAAVNDKLAQPLIFCLSHSCKR